MTRSPQRLLTDPWRITVRELPRRIPDVAADELVCAGVMLAGALTLWVGWAWLNRGGGAC